MRVLVIDDHSIIRVALKLILADLADGVDLVYASNGPDGLARAEEAASPFDLVITDLYMPGGGIDTISLLVAKAAPAPVVCFTVSERASDIRGVLGAGARAYVPKTTSDPLIISILRLVMAGGTYVPPSLSGLSAGDPGSAPEVPPGLEGPLPSAGGGGDVALAERRPATTLPPLTRRQYQVLELLAEGMSNAGIGQRLDLNLSTVKSHVTGILRSLNVSSRTQAVLAFKQSEWGRR